MIKTQMLLKWIFKKFDGRMPTVFIFPYVGDQLTRCSEHGSELSGNFLTSKRISVLKDPANFFVDFTTL
jgi:hypothetical protein